MSRFTIFNLAVGREKVNTDKKAQEVENTADSQIKNRETTHKDLGEKQKEIDSMPENLSTEKSPVTDDSLLFLVLIAQYLLQLLEPFLCFRHLLFEIF